MGCQSLVSIVLSIYVVIANFPILSCRRVVLSSSNKVSPDSLNHLNSSSLHRRLEPINAESHRVVSLPGLKEKVNHYAGHLTVDPDKGSNLFYWLIEAQTVDPLTGEFYTINDAVRDMFDYFGNHKTLDRQSSYR